MPQTTFQFVSGYLRLTLDTLSQRFVNRHAPPNHTLFTSSTYLTSKTVIITGANTGIGLETARQFCSAGAHVVLACRSLENARAAIRSIRDQIPNAHLETMLLDLADLQSVRRFVQNFQGRNLDVLVLNAGVMAARKQVPEMHFVVNHVGHALLTILLIPALKKAHKGRVVFVSSLTCVVSDLRFDDLSFEKRDYNWMTAYANSKLAMILFMKALARRIKGTGICVNAVHPGEATSDVARYLGKVWHFLHTNVGKLFLLSSSEAARTSVYVGGSKEMEGVSGHVFHRVWQKMDVPERLVGDGDVERMWQTTLNYAHVTDPDLHPLQHLAKEAGGDVSLVGLPE